MILKLSYASLQRSTAALPPGVWRVEKMQDHMEIGHGGHMVCSLFRKRDGTYRENLRVL